MKNINKKREQFHTFTASFLSETMLAFLPEINIYLCFSL